VGQETNLNEHRNQRHIFLIKKDTTFKGSEISRLPDEPTRKRREKKTKKEEIGGVNPKQSREVRVRRSRGNLKF